MLINTKFHPPSLQTGLLVRKNLIDKLRAATGSALISISGPVGSGKTSLACQWIKYEKLPVAWYSLDEEDNMPDLFFRYLLTTLIRTDKHLNNMLGPLLVNGHALSAKNIIPCIIEAITSLPYAVRLVLDGFHYITNSCIHDALARLMRYMPNGFQLVVLSRYNLPAPVDAAVVKRNLTEITAEELKLTETESLDLFKKVISKGFPAELVRQLHLHVGGGAAGLQLIGLLIQSKGTLLDLSSDHFYKVAAAGGMSRSHPAAPCTCAPVANPALTQREIEILGWVAQGFQNKEIAQKAFIAITTVKSHVSNIMVKLDVKTRTQAILKAKEMNILMI